MNSGKICVSVCAETAEEFIRNTERAAKVADIVELRFDCLIETELEKALSATVFRAGEKPFIVTYRPEREGGRRDLTLRERVKFWESVLLNNRRKNLLADVEFDLQNLLNLKQTVSIISLHNFSDAPDDLPAMFEIYRSVRSAGIIKFAVAANDAGDSTAVWNLLEKAKCEGKPFVPVAMGESGKWTRVLALAHGAPFVYASLDAGFETAPGQLTAKDLTEIYRVKELNKETEIYGVVGNPVAHSLSPAMHNAAFRASNLDAVYIPLAVKNLDEFIKKFIRGETREVELNFKGFSLTVPHKQAIIKHLDSMDETARRIGAVNTVKIEDGNLRGYNTDAEGFIEPLKNIYGDLKDARAAILGAGGAARACVYALEKENARVSVFARDVKKAEKLAEDFAVEAHDLATADFKNFDIIVNATPLGTKGELEEITPVFAAQIETVKLIYDLIYNPSGTALIEEARKANVSAIGGLAMLAAQGAKQFEIWTGKPAPSNVMSEAAAKQLSDVG